MAIMGSQQAYALALVCRPYILVLAINLLGLDSLIATQS